MATNISELIGSSLKEDLERLNRTMTPGGSIPDFEKRVERFDFFLANSRNDTVVRYTNVSEEFCKRVVEGLNNSSGAVENLNKNPDEKGPNRNVGVKWWIKGKVKPIPGLEGAGTDLNRLEH